MKQGLRNVAVGCAAVGLLMGASAGAANASYLGYGNGDPGNWGFWQEQHPNSVHKSKAHVHQTAMHHHPASAQKNKQS